MRKLLGWCGVDPEQISKWNFENIQARDALDLPDAPRQSALHFEERSLPDGEILDPNNPQHAPYCEYITGRGLDPLKYPYMVTPREEGRNSQRIIIPYTYKNKIVGHTSRYLDGRIPKYINHSQRGYVFGYDLQKPQWTQCIVVEGQFDAIAIDGCALGHNTVNPEQAALLRTLNREIIMVPDRDAAGLKICDLALELGWRVSIPEWDRGVKDVNDAVNKYGKLPTLLSILQSATTSKIKVEMSRRKLVD